MKNEKCGEKFERKQFSIKFKKVKIRFSPALIDLNNEFQNVANLKFSDKEIFKIKKIKIVSSLT